MGKAAAVGHKKQADVYARRGAVTNGDVVMWDAEGVVGQRSQAVDGRVPSPSQMIQVPERRPRLAHTTAARGVGKDLVARGLGHDRPDGPAMGIRWAKMAALTAGGCSVEDRAASRRPSVL